jgi:hypothetical protein
MENYENQPHSSQIQEGKSTIAEGGAVTEGGARHWKYHTFTVILI